MSPRRAVQRVRSEADTRQLDPSWVRALVEVLRERMSALDLSGGQEERILLAGGAEHWRTLLESEGFDVVRVLDGPSALNELANGSFLGALVDAGFAGDGRSLLRESRERPELRSLRFALVGADLEPEEVGPLVWAVPAPSADAVRAVLRSWRRS